MIISIGTDIISVKRIAKSIKSQRFIERIFLENEIIYCQSMAKSEIHFSARFAAKEAALKALGTGMAEGIILKHVEILRDNKGKPFIQFHDKAKEKFFELCGDNGQVHLSLSHEKLYAVAMVIIERC